MNAESIPNMIDYCKKLEEVGFTTQQARVQSEAFYTMVEEKLFTKQDFQSFIKNDFEPLKRNIDTRFEHLEKKFEAKFDQIDIRFERIDNRFEKIDNEFAKVRTEMSEMKHDLKSWFGRCMIGLATLISSLVASLAAIMHFIK